jgi:predicted branched-subunit amino acid permease
VKQRRLTGAARLVERRRENVEILMGVLGFFIGLLLIVTVVAEVKGDDTLARALVLALLVGLFYVLVRIRRVLQRQLAALLGGSAAARTRQ